MNIVCEMAAGCSTKTRVKGTKDMAAMCIVFSLLLFLSSIRAGESCKTDYSEYGFALIDHVYESILVDRLVSCYMVCTTQPACQSLNYNLADKTCELNNDTKYYRPKYFVEKPTFVYAENRDSGKLFTAYTIIFHTSLSLFLRPHSTCSLSREFREFKKRQRQRQTTTPQINDLIG